MRRLELLTLLLFTTLSAGAERHPRVILAVFAHPDDETFVGPVLARYAREGVKVYLAIATKGEKGTSDPSLRGVHWRKCGARTPPVLAVNWV
jgi:LmbE family N-acetylglucosaminyl deacetylase